MEIWETQCDQYASWSVSGWGVRNLPDFLDEILDEDGVHRAGDARTQGHCP